MRATFVRPFKGAYAVGTIDTSYPTRARVIVEAEWDGDRLSVSGTAKRPGAHDIDWGGQIQGDLRKLAYLDEIEYADGWDRERLTRLLDLWERWHLNDMRAGCEHQRALGWTYDEHPSEPCPVCGYKFGTAWLREDVPDDVLVQIKEGAAS